ncbi:hypothetical protein ANCCEY_09379 [Ancylostoma ceylanicum]|uniref:Major facilitator superfamily (MFS) profile domain-containing protein n=1 Tax=Ancylostoma ceylanicum TaxID=53326 RepID=A0A0D6LV51_9BILA|nr:hypothetical protein ANCCEY_09379 [Ancylostoma ceylanicum]
MENIPKKHRMWINMAITWSPNMPPIALLAWLTGEWRMLALNCWYRAFVRESPRWLIHRGKIDEAADIMRIKFCRGKVAAEEIDGVILKEYELAHRADAKKRKYSLHHLFYSPKLAITTTVLAFS